MKCAHCGVHIIPAEPWGLNGCVWRRFGTGMRFCTPTSDTYAEPGDTP